MRATKPLSVLTAGDVMMRDLVTIPQSMSLPDAAHVLRQANVSGAPVVDAHGLCVGVLTAVDFLRWAEGLGSDTEKVRPRRFCPYLERGHPENACDIWICVLSEGSCPFQVTQPMTEGRHISLCTRPGISLADWQQFCSRLPGDSVQRFMTADLVTVSSQTSLPNLARIMVDGGIHRVFIIDERGRPIGVVSSTDLLAALAAEGSRQEMLAGV